MVASGDTKVYLYATNSEIPPLRNSQNRRHTKTVLLAREIVVKRRLESDSGLRSRSIVSISVTTSSVVTLIGKALEPLAKGSGEILVLLSLQ